MTMTRLAKMAAVETKLFFREPATWIVSLLLPTTILLVLGALVPGRPDKAFGGQRFIDFYVPSLVVITLATLGVNTLPIRLTTWREKGVLRRLSTTPIRPATLLGIQLGVNMAVAIAAVLLLIVLGRLAFQISLPRHAAGFAAAFLLGMAALFAVGMLIAAVAPSARAGSAVSLPVFFLTMFLGGVYLPRLFLPKFLIRMGDYAPPGIQALLDAWRGIAPHPLQLATMAAIAVVAGLAAARWFRWD